MARIVFPSAFDSWVRLTEKVNERNEIDSNNTLLPFLTENGIDLTADLEATLQAVVENEKQNKFERDADYQYKQRDILFNPVFAEQRDMVQFLKKLYRNNPHKLGDWSVTVDSNGRISYPITFEGKAAAVLAFITKHESYSPETTSPLYPYLTTNNINITTNKTKTETAVIAHNKAVEYTSDKEIATQERNLLLEPVMSHLRGIGGYLVDLFSKNPNKAGDWGYRIDNSTQSPTTRNILLTPGQIKTVANVALDSQAANIGETTIKIYKGKTTDGEAIELLPNQIFTIIRGYGTLTLKNISNTSSGDIQVEITR